MLIVEMKALEMVRVVGLLLPRIGRGSRALADQLDRASLSVPLNVAEGLRSQGGHRAARLHTALGSARETVMQHLYRAFPESPTWDGLPTRGDFPTDFILFRENERGGVRYVDGSERRLEDRHGSDHHARMARFSFAR